MSETTGRDTAHGWLPTLSSVIGPGTRTRSVRTPITSSMMLLISAGFDAHRADPLAQLQLDEDDFAWATAALCALADRVCGGRVVSALEGGYDLEATARSAQAHVRALMAASGSQHG